MSDQRGRTATAARLRDVSARHPLTVFNTMVFGIGWPILAVPVLADRGLIGGSTVPAEFFALGVTWFVLLPAALWVTAVTEGRKAARLLLGRAFRWRLGAWWPVVLLALPAATLAVGLALGGSLHAPTTMPVVRGLVSLITAVVLIHLWEETVWAGFLQTRLERRHTLVVAALVTSVPFAGIHLPLLLIGATSVWPVVVGAAKLLVLGAAMRLMLGVILRGTGSLLAVGLLHGVFNASNNRGGLVDTLLDGADQNLAAPIAMVLVTVAVAAVVFGRRSQDRPQPSHDRVGTDGRTTQADRSLRNRKADQLSAHTFKGHP